MLHFHDLAFFRADEAYGVVSVKALVNATEFLGGSLSVVGRSVHGNQVVELISSVDVQQLADRAEPVRRVVVPSVRHVVVQPPGLAAVPVVREEMNVGAFHVVYFAEKSVLSHVQG